jgi:hypothetical protein
MNPATPSEFWKATGVACKDLARDWAKHHAPAVPETLPSFELETDCDRWIHEHAAHLMTAGSPPDELADWLRIRAAVAAGCALVYGKKNAPIPARPESVWEQLLIEEWHRRLNSHWREQGEERN